MPQTKKNEQMKNVCFLSGGKAFFIAFLLVQSNVVLAQSNQVTGKYQQEINVQVWKPFIKAYAAHDAQLYNSLHADDILRVNEQGIRIGEQYKKSNTKNFQRNKSQGSTAHIEFKFISRQANEQVAYEVGVYKGVFVVKGKTYIGYGNFHVVLRKIKGRWKIMQDWDSVLIGGKKIDEAHYQAMAGVALK